MASIDKVKGGWRARWRTPDGRQRSRTFKRKVDAQRHLTSTEHSKLSGLYVDPADGRLTIEVVGRRWLAAQVWRPSTEAHKEGHLVNHIFPALGGRPVNSVRPSDVQSFVKALSTKLAAGTVRGIYGTLAAVLRSAANDRLISSSPCTGIKLPAETSRLVVPLTLEQIEAAADAVGDRYRPLVVLGAGAGLRIGEALGLAVDSVNFLPRTISVTQQSVTVRRVTSLGPPKTAASIRTVPMAATVAAELAAYIKRHPTPGLLVADPSGGPIPQNRFSQTWARAVAKAGLPKGTRYHDLRHTFASALISSGCSVKAVQAALGHESAAVLRITEIPQCRSPNFPS